jgi:hypothetical protein
MARMMHSSATIAARKENQMSTDQRHVTVSNWLYPSKIAATFAIWPVSDSADLHPELKGRVSITIDSGCASMSIRPTRAEVMSLIETLRWALAVEEVAA